MSIAVSAKLHYTDTGYGHVYNTAKGHATTILQLVVQQIHHQRTKICLIPQHLDMSRCWALALRCGKFVVQQVVELLGACPLVVLYNMSVAGVRLVEFGTYHTAVIDCNKE